jgi:hypothetical protein
MELLVEHSMMKFQIDAGSPVTLINEKVWKKLGQTILNFKRELLTS